MPIRRPSVWIALCSGSLACLLLAAWLWIGIVQDAEFKDEYSLFWKERPTFKIWFRSPVGMSDLRIEDLSRDDQIAERDYRYYVLGMQK
jgi:hypothetical protein